MHNTKKWLYANAAFSGFSGCTALALNEQLQVLFGFSHPYIFPVIGGGLLLFVAQLLWVAFQTPTNRKAVTLISTLDATWVLASTALLIFRPFQLSASGYIIVAIVAGLVGLFGYQQYKSVRYAHA